VLDVDARNAIIWRENQNRQLNEILDESKFVFERLLQIVRLLPESDLTDAYAYDRYVIPFWGKSMALWECIAGDSHEHYREHTANIRRGLDMEMTASRSMRTVST
jgi:hypothetical protein